MSFYAWNIHRSVSSDFTNKKKNPFSWTWSATRIELKILSQCPKKTFEWRSESLFTLLYSDFLYSCQQQWTIKMETKIQLMVPVSFSISAVYKHQTSERYFSLRKLGKLRQIHIWDKIRNKPMIFKVWIGHSHSSAVWACIWFRVWCVYLVSSWVPRLTKMTLRTDASWPSNVFQKKKEEQVRTRGGKNEAI